MPGTGERLFLLASAAVAASIPYSLHRLVDHRLHRGLEPALTRALSLPVAVGDVEADLFGAVTLRRVRAGEAFTADAVSAGVGLSHLLSGRFRADEIEVVRPRLVARLDGGRLDLGVRRGAGGSGGVGRPRRIRVRGGEVVVTLAGTGEVRAEDVDLYPQEGGVRLVTGRSTLVLSRDRFSLTATFARAGVDVALPSLQVTRAALDGGTVTVAAAGAPPLVVERATIVHGADTRVAGDIRGEGPATLRVDPGGLTFTARAQGVPLAPLAPLLPDWVAPLGRVGGEITGHLHEGDVDLEVALRLDGVALAHPIVSATPLPLTLGLDGSLALRPAARAARARAQLVSGPLRLAASADGALTADGSLARLVASAELSRVGCAEGLTGLPPGLRQPLDGLDLGGNVSGRAELSWNAAHPDDTRLTVDLDVGCEVDRVPAALADLAGPHVHTLPDGSVRRLAPGDPHFVALRALPRHVSVAFVAAEDARFYQHHGFDADQMRRSLARNLAAQRVERGGSTISQQLVKNLYLTRDRTLARKLVEAVLTYVVEARLGKDRILELYLDVIELGDGVYGIEPGARRWFGKSPRDLSIAEAAFLASIAPAPLTAERRLRGLHHLDDEAEARARVILRGMRAFLGDAAARAEAELPRLYLR